VYNTKFGGRDTKMAATQSIPIVLILWFSNSILVRIITSMNGIPMAKINQKSINFRYDVIGKLNSINKVKHYPLGDAV
jgi:hypothetical protein